MADPRPTPAPPQPPSAIPPSRSSRPRTPPQYSMRSLMMVVTAVAVASALLSYAGVSIVFLAAGIAILFVVPVCLGTLALYCRGLRQTFFAGAFLGAFAPHFSGDASIVKGIGQFLFLCMLQLVACACCGYAALATRRFLERRGWHRPPR